MNKPFSPNSAREAIDELFQALPKSKRLDHLGAFNEATIVVGQLAKLAGLTGDQLDQPVELRQ